MLPSSASNAPAPSGLRLGDLLYVIFRHKWKISLISLAAIAGAAGLFFFGPVPYYSDARLLVKYIVENKALATGTGDDTKVKVPDDRSGQAVINNEIEILTSLDLARQVATNLPPDTLDRLGGRTNALLAAFAIQKGLAAQVVQKSDVIDVRFSYRDPLVVQPVLQQLVTTYLTRQAQIHSAASAYTDYLSRQRDALRLRLSDTEDQLRRAKERAGTIFSLDDTRKTYSDQMAKIQQALLDTEAQYAEQKADVGAMRALLPTNSQPGAALATLSALGAGASDPSGTNSLMAVPSETRDEYRRLLSRLQALGKQDQDLLLQFTPQSRAVKPIEDEIAAAEKRKEQLEAQYPALLATASAAPSQLQTAQSGVLGTELNLIAQAAQIPGLESKIRVLTNQLQKVTDASAALSTNESTIVGLELTRKMLDGQLNSFENALDELEADQQMGAARSSNIIAIQSPSPAARSPSKLLKTVAMVLFGGIGLAFGLAFALEFYVDSSLRRPGEVETRLHLPFYLSIPRLALKHRANGKVRLLPWAENRLPDNRQPTTGRGQRTALSSVHPYCEALRDRLITYFELHNLTHKPKLVALTSCSEGAGVSTLAAGLAASLSETGDGNVLLVSIDHDGAAQEFQRGDLTCGIDAALEAGSRDQALVQDNLYVVAEGHDANRLPQALPRRFKHLVPRLKTSDYDYIVFDMPPLSQISVTTRLARFMDMVLIVAESEKTDRDVLKSAGALLAESKTNFGILLNKTRSYVPRKLLQEF